VFWLNLLLGISNALPAYPFDGGHLFHGFVSWLLEKIGYGDEEKRQNATDSIMNSVSTLVLFMFGLVVVAMLI
jgi:membrane-associated protease RseP (regulator of RpoE activity)